MTVYDALWWLLILATGWLLAAVLVCLLFAFASDRRDG